MAKTQLNTFLYALRTFAILLFLNICVLASEDSIEEVMKDYENPQTLFKEKSKTMPLDTSKNTITNTQSNQIHSVNRNQTTIKGQYGFVAPSINPPPNWIYSTAIVEVVFDDGSFKRGIGTLLKNGLYITSSEIIYNNKIVPKHIYAKMQDDLNAQILCVSALNVKMVDLDAGLALLQVSYAVDGYCQKSEMSYYQDRIFKRFGIDVFASHTQIKPKTKAHYPYLNAEFVFIPQSTHLNKIATYYNFQMRKELIYGFEIDENSYEEFTYGKAFYDDNGVFLGVMSRAGVGYMPVFIHRDVVQDFLCFASEREIISDVDIKQKCQLLGNDRKRFFTDMGGRVNFY